LKALEFVRQLHCKKASTTGAWALNENHGSYRPEPTTMGFLKVEAPCDPCTKELSNSLRKNIKEAVQDKLERKEGKED
jgi:hypothetical protein